MALIACVECARIISDRAPRHMCRECREEGTIEDLLTAASRQQWHTNLVAAIERGKESGVITPTLHYTNA